MVTLVIVTHDSAAVLPRCLDAVAEQTMVPEQVVIVDSGSNDPGYLDRVSDRAGHRVYRCENVGFAAANNCALRHVKPPVDYLILLNPDAFMSPHAVEYGIRSLERQPRAAIIGGRLVGFDLMRQQPTAAIDSTGVFRRWYGRWYDRGQGEPDDNRYRHAGSVPAVCGAFMCCRGTALADIWPDVFDERFFLYKEDIDLCLRLSRRGWSCFYEPEIVVHHCRGWNARRRQMTRALRLQAARSELQLTVKHRSPYVIWAVAKYLAVWGGDL